MKKRILLVSLTIVFICAEEVAARHIYQADGYQRIERIISLAPSITKAIYLLGVDDKLIANTTYCISPVEANKKEKIGTAIEVNIEKVFNLKPDLVLATSLTNFKAVKKLRDLGIKVIIFPAPKDFDELCKQFLELSNLVGKEKEGQKIIVNVKDKVSSIKKEVKNLPHPKVLLQIGARPLFVATGSYFVNDYIEFAGGINIAKSSNEGIYSRELVLKADPDIIIITTMGIVGEEEKNTWKGYKILSAVKKNRIYIVESDKISSPTPESFIDALEEFVRILHPKEK